MKPKYKNAIFETLRDSSLGLENFRFETLGVDQGGNEHSNIVFLENNEDSNFIFNVVENVDEFGQFSYRYIEYTPKAAFSEFYPIDGWSMIGSVLNSIGFWIKHHITNYLEDNNDIDLWEEYLKRDKLIPIQNKDYQDLETFTPSEKQSLHLSINELKILIAKRFELDEANQKIVIDRLDYLSESLDRSTNKTDWKGILINTVISITIALSLDTQKGQDLYSLFVQIMQVLPVLSS